MAIADLIVRDVSLDPVREVWDDLLRLIATIEQGWRTATDVLEHFGSAARGDRIYRAGHALGQLLRTIYLCDYFTLVDFRRSIYQVLERGESVHALQRQICSQALPAKRGRRTEELIATSGALTLVTNRVMAWNTQRLQRAVDRESQRIAPRYSVEALRSIGPVGHRTSTCAARIASRSSAMPHASSHQQFALDLPRSAAGKAPVRPPLLRAWRDGRKLRGGNTRQVVRSSRKRKKGGR
jgi:hypothetical protein